MVTTIGRSVALALQQLHTQHSLRRTSTPSRQKIRTTWIASLPRFSFQTANGWSFQRAMRRDCIRTSGTPGWRPLVVRARNTDLPI